MSGASKAKISQRQMNETTSGQKHMKVESLVHLASTTKMLFERRYYFYFQSKDILAGN